MKLERHYLSWKVFYEDVCQLADMVRTRALWQGMVVITRGGLVPGAILAHQLGIRAIDTICIASYNEQDKQADLKILKEAPGDGEGWLVIDDLVDSGMTLKAVRKRLPKAHFAAVYAKPLGRPLVDSYVKDVSQDSWLVFPWEEKSQ